MKRVISGIIFFCLLFLPVSNSFSQTDINTNFALNFPFRNPETASFKIYFELLKELNIKVIRQLTFGDVFWAQVEATNNIWTFAQADSGIGNNYGIIPVPTLYSMFGEDTVGFQLPWKATTKPSGGWTVADSNDTKDYLSTVINRYKTKTKYWEVGNELNSHNRKPKSFSPVELVDFMRLNYRWIKAIDPAAFVVLPGMLGTFGYPMVNAYEWLRSFLRAGGGSTFDIMNYHDYNSWWTLPLHLDSIKAVMRQFGIQKSIWVSECSISSDNTSPITPSYSSIDEQAADAWRRPVVTFASGLNLFYWQALWSSAGASEWKHFGLTDQFGRKKKSFHSFKLCMDKLDNFVSVEKISSGVINDDNNAGGGGLWVYKFIARNGSTKYVMWASPNRVYELTGLTESKATVTSVVPVSVSTDGQTAVWDISVKNVSGGKITVNLTNLPVLVEAGEPTGLESIDQLPARFELLQNYPNPFNPKTTISYSIPIASVVSISIYNLLGEKLISLADEFKLSGNYKVDWNANNFPSGLYFYKIEAVPVNGEKPFYQIKKMILLK